MNGNQESFEEKITSLNNTADTTAEFDQQDINNNKVMAILAYFGILVLVPILGAKESKFARFHANQGLVLCVCGCAVWLVVSILTSLIIAQYSFLKNFESISPSFLGSMLPPCFSNECETLIL